MIMMGRKFMDDVPFHEVYVHGLVRDADGQKMSKSKGNVLDPIDLIDGITLDELIEKRVTGLMQPQMADRIRKSTRRQFPDGIPAFGTDALRFTFAALATQGRDIRFDLNRIEGYRNFCNKLWNAARYVLMQTDGGCTTATAAEHSLADRWIVSLLQRTADEVNQHIRSYRFDLAAKALYDFTWREYCDWYLELSKPVLTDPDASQAQRSGTLRTLVEVLDALLRLLHPLMPYLTEEIWQQVRPAFGKTDQTIQLEPYPEGDPTKIDPEAIEEIEWVKGFVMGVRRIRAEMDIAPGKALPLLMQNWTERDRERQRRNQAYIQFLARPDSIDWLEPDAEAPESATALVGEMTILIPLSGLIDKEAEQARLEKEIGKLRGNLDKGEAKLDNANFIERAPAEVVDKERQRVADMRAALAQLEAQLDKIRAL
jgi:valyl-tRNA synthetase